MDGQANQAFQALAVSMANQVIQVKMEHQDIQALAVGQARLVLQEFQATVDGAVNQALAVK